LEGTADPAGEDFPARTGEVIETRSAVSGHLADSWLTLLISCERRSSSAASIVRKNQESQIQVPATAHGVQGFYDAAA
jgi:hypothetical protein